MPGLLPIFIHFSITPKVRRRNAITAGHKSPRNWYSPMNASDPNPQVRSTMDWPTTFVKRLWRLSSSLRQHKWGIHGKEGVGVGGGAFRCPPAGSRELPPVPAGLPRSAIRPGSSAESDREDLESSDILRSAPRACANHVETAPTSLAAPAPAEAATKNTAPTGHPKAIKRCDPSHNDFSALAWCLSVRLLG